ncbi:hypothetical protein BYT27DRAFT_7189569 [Phlegmacium glaucopus]|nr:hypothetical protein BYT27DRAFT_7189569 [Phlegmacium glaucopus]
MPRATQQTLQRSPTSSTNPLIAAPSAHPNVLKRNQACHQCRRRKLKCDAKRPCSTCVRSHAHGALRAPTITKEPECTYDEVTEVAATPEGPKNRYERLEHRINELEALLQQKENGSISEREPEFYSEGEGNDHSHITRSPSQLLHAKASFISEPTSSPPGLEMIWTTRPPSLPGPELLRHLVDVFFKFHPHAGRLFHATSFINSLSLPPTHPRFPSIPVLHAICAIGSFYTAAVTSPPLPDFNQVSPEEIFTERSRYHEQRTDSFAEQQAKLARESAERLNSIGKDLFQVCQANIILTWFYWSLGRWVDIFLLSAHSLRLSVPLGLNICPPFHSIAKTVRPPSILLPARTVIEDETRRNSFWLAYATERQHGCGNGWALFLDDQDVSQLLPVRGDQFEQGILVPPIERQWAQSRDLLLVHPENQTDSFILYIKSTILISQVKSFNTRFRSKHFMGDASIITLYTDNATAVHDPIDPRGSAAFIELDHIVSSFRVSFPIHLRNPIVNNVVDNHLYTACLTSLAATIMLHDPHADVRLSGCISALKLLTAARTILDLIYTVWSTSFDITLLDLFCSFCWFLGGRVLVRFLQAALETQSLDQISTLRAEIDFIYVAIAKLGQRIPLAHKFSRMLKDLIIKDCGPAFQIPIQMWLPQVQEPRLLGALVEEHSQSGSNPHENRERGPFLSLGQ